MKPGTIQTLLLSILITWCLTVNAAQASVEITRTYNLKPGWNSIFLEIEPKESDPANLLAVLPEGSALWTWMDRQSPVEFIRNPDEKEWDQKGWRVIVKSADKGFLSNLHSIPASRAYLIKIVGTRPIDWNVTGIPSVKPMKWATDSFNLVSFRLTRENHTTTFQNYFNDSPAHRGQAIYRLGSGGAWERVINPKTMTIRSGEAYWVYCSGASTFQGPLDITLPDRSGIHYPPGAARRSMVVTNVSNRTRKITIALKDNAVPLTYREFDTEINAFRYKSLATPLSFTLAPSERKTLHLTLRREALAVGDAGSVLSVTDLTGTRIQVPVTLESSDTAPAAGALLPGLWMGTATLNQVSNVNTKGSDLAFDLKIVGVNDAETLVPALAALTGDDRWKIHSDGTYPRRIDNRAWNETEYIDTTWAFWDNAPDQSTDTKITTYFRKTFEVPENVLRKRTSLKLKLQADDGIAVYINGVLVHRRNLTVLANSALADKPVTGPAESQFVEFTVPATLIKAGINSIAAEVHQATKKSDEDLRFDLTATACIEDDLISFGSDQWSYSDAGTVPAPDWNSRTYTVTNPLWKSGTALFGHGDKDIRGIDRQKTTVENRRAVYFRKSFDIQDPGTYDNYFVKFVADDGAVVYLNRGADGAPAPIRFNMPAEGDITHNTAPERPRRASEENQIQSYKITGIQSGTNTVAVEVHQYPSELATGNENEGAPLKTTAEMTLRLLLHADDKGSVRLLKEVILMKEKGEAARPVLITDHAKIPNYKGVGRRDGTDVSRRVSTIGFDFPDQESEYPGTLSMAKNGNTLSCEFTIGRDHPTNPFRHQYHPDHDNLNARYKDFEEADGFQEVPEITRKISISVDKAWSGDDDTKPPGWGLTRLDGTYTEVLSGLHKNDITVRGTFELNQVNDVTALNP